MDCYLNYSSLKENFNLKKYKIYNLEKLKLLAEKGEIRFEKRSNKWFFNVEDIKSFFLKIDNIYFENFTFEEFLEVFVKDYLPEVDYLRFINCKKEFMKLGLKINYDEFLFEFFVNKKSYYDFKDSHISVYEAYQRVAGYRSIFMFVNKLNIAKVPFIKIKNKYNYKVAFIKIENLASFTIKEKETEIEFVKISDAIRFLGIPRNKFYKVLKENNINIKNEKNDFFTFIEKKEMNFLLEKQEKIYEHFKQNYYTLDDAIKFFDENGFSNKNDIDNSIKREQIPTIISFREYKYKNIVYLKGDFIEFYSNNLNNKKRYNLYESIEMGNPYPHFLYIVSELDCDLPINNLTKETWYKFVNNKLTNTLSSDRKKINLIRTFVNVTSFLSEILGIKEIFEYSVKELNLLIFNSNTPYTYKHKLIIYIRQLNKSLILRNRKPIDVNKLNFDRTPTNPRDTAEVYSYDEFYTLLNKLNDSEYIRTLILSDLKNMSNAKYKKLDSIWLYMLLHFCNGWRSGDFTSFERLDAELYEELCINNYAELCNLQLDMDFVRRVINKYKTKIFIHNKNGERAKFYCPEFLSISFVFAVVFCEYRSRNLDGVYNDNLINFYVKQNNYSNKIGKRFMKTIGIEIDFNSRKLNKSILSLYRKFSFDVDPSGDSLEVSKHLRGHKSSNTTHQYYINVPPHEINQLIRRLFDLDYYGYIYRELSTKLSAAETTDISLIYSNSRLVNLIFGDVLKLENSVRIFEYLEKRKIEIQIVIENFTEKELETKMNIINLGKGFSKQENYQCLFSNCIAKNTDCNNCMFSIPHFYNLSNLSKRIKSNIENYLQEEAREDSIIGELQRLYNLMIKDYICLLEAEEKFGTDVIDFFLKEEFEQVISKLNNLNDPNDLEEK